MITRNLLVNRNTVTSVIRTFLIPKGKGKFRKIYTETNEITKRLFKLVSKHIEEEVILISKMYNLDECIHAFVRGRNPVTNATKHIGFRYTISYDLKDFFESVTRDKLTEYLNDDILDLIVVDGAARQGLSTSPNAANLAFMEVDHKIIDSLNGLATRYCYTRYADDITISFDDSYQLQYIDQIVSKHISDSGFILNRNKTTLQCARHGRRLITGVAVDDVKVYPTRYNKRRARAALHNELTWASTHTGKYRLRRLHQKAIGLTEWCKCKQPRRQYGI